MEVKPRDLAYWDARRHTWRVEQEEIRLLAGGSSDNLPVQATAAVETAAEFRP
jgi:hypothetical protein